MQADGAINHVRTDGNLSSIESGLQAYSYEYMLTSSLQKYTDLSVKSCFKSNIFASVQGLENL